MVSLYSALFVCVCISLLLHSHVAKYYATTAYASCENSKGTDYITRGLALAPPDCSGGCALSWVLVVAAHMVGLSVTGAALLCAVPGPWARCTMVVGVLVVPSHWWALWAGI